jgi:hypothetical protein
MVRREVKQRIEVGKNAPRLAECGKEVRVASVEQFDSFFQKLSSQPGEFFPDGIVDITIRVLHALRLLSEDPPTVREAPANSLLQAVESEGRITLYNDKFALWIVPQANAPVPTTITYIARRMEEAFSPEVAFRTQGIHNRSKTILKLIDRYLIEIQETESVIASLESPPPAQP